MSSARMKALEREEAAYILVSPDDSLTLERFHCIVEKNRLPIRQSRIYILQMEV